MIMIFKADKMMAKQNKGNKKIANSNVMNMAQIKSEVQNFLTCLGRC